ncbi:MAG: divergent polysaccharide deacetylase family protein [Desulfobacterales bacterium]
MAKKRRTTQSTKSKKKASKKKSGLKQNLIKIVWGMAVLILLVSAAAVIAHYLLYRMPLEKKEPPVQALSSKKKSSATQPPDSRPAAVVPTYEIFAENTPYPPPPPATKKRVVEQKPISGKPLPKVAIIIDDLGYDAGLAKKFIRLDSGLTVSILPYGPFNQEILKLAKETGSETMLHLPMEPREYPRIKPGPGALYSTMSPDALIAQLEADLDSVPGAKGVNNHMGSKMTADSTRMYQIFSILKKKGLFFVDSKTAPDSICKPSARMFQVPFAQRDVFIDHIQEREFIQNQIHLLMRIAENRGSAVGIAHPHEITYEVMKVMLPELRKRTNIVPVSHLVEKPT